MRSPWTIGLLSLFPGLGFLVLGKYKAALIALGLFVLLFSFGLFAANEFLAELTLTLSFAVWFLQILYAFQAARREELASTADPRAPKQVQLSKTPRGMSAAERLTTVARQHIEPQLEPKENLRAALLGLDMGNFLLFGWFAMKQFYIGVTQDHLIRVELDWLGKPYQLHRDPLHSVDRAQLKHGILQDRLRIQLKDQKARSYRVQRWVREESRKLVEAIGKE